MNFEKYENSINEFIRHKMEKVKKPSKDKKDSKDDSTCKKEKVEINPMINEGVAQIRNKLLQQVGASSKRTKQWIPQGGGKIRVEMFDDGPNTLYVRFHGEGLSEQEAKTEFAELRKKIRVFAAREGVMLIQAAPKIPDQVKGKEHIALGSYNQQSKRMTLEVSLLK